MTETTPVGLTNTLRPEMKNLSNEEKKCTFNKTGNPFTIYRDKRYE